MKINIIRKIVPNWAKKLLRQLILSTPSAKKKKLAEEIKKEKSIKKTDALLDNIFKFQEQVVINGPFKGMKYINASNGSALLPKLVGSYEEPIHKWVYYIRDEAKYSFILDVGCAEGYYAIGLCKAKSSPRVFAYDINIQALSNAKELASKNGVLERISFGECFDPKVLDSVRANHPGQKILIFMDVEGAEIDLLNTFDFPSILECDILVELHDCFKANLTDSIVKYFANTHEIELVFDYPWRNGNYSLNGAILTPEELEFMVDEKRPSAMRWMYARRS